MLYAEWNAGWNRWKASKSASVNLATEKARVEYDSDFVNSSAMKTKIKELGYQVLETPQRFPWRTT